LSRATVDLINKQKPRCRAGHSIIAENAEADVDRKLKATQAVHDELGRIGVFRDALIALQNKLVDSEVLVRRSLDAIEGLDRSSTRVP
jgi:hypothetical protein